MYKLYIYIYMHEIINFNKSDKVAKLFDGEWRKVLHSCACSRMDRTEDVRFSPSGNKIALAGYTLNNIYIFDINIDGDNISLLDYYEINCDNFKNPHGVAWIDENTIVVTCRFSPTVILRLPTNKPDTGVIKLEPVKIITKHINGTSSIVISKIDDNKVELLLCSNVLNIISRHVLNSNNFDIIEESKFLSNFKVPDGISITSDRKWIAVSNHDAHNILVYKNENITVNSVPSAILKCEFLRFPHGLCFYNNLLYVNDAGSNYIYVFKNVNGNWVGDIDISFRIESMSVEDYTRAKVNDMEGGAKGLDIFRNILAITSANCPLKFFKLS